MQRGQIEEEVAKREARGHVLIKGFTKKLPTKPMGTIQDSGLPGTLEKLLVLKVMLLLHLAGEDSPFGHIAAGS